MLKRAGRGSGWLLVLTSLSGCHFDASISPGAPPISCQTTADCPTGYTCRPQAGCLKADAVDPTGPSLVRSSLGKSVVAPGGTVPYEFETTKALLHEPEVHVSAGALSLSTTADAGSSPTSFLGTMVVPSPWPDSVAVVRTTLVDQSGNEVDALVGTFTVDGTPARVVPGTATAALVADADAGVTELFELGPHGSLHLSFAMSEPLGAAPVVAGHQGATELASCAAATGSGTNWQTDCRLLDGLVSPGAVRLELSVDSIDLAGNAGHDELTSFAGPVTMVVVRVDPPPSPAVDLADAVVLVRAPYGVGASAPGTRVLLSASATVVSGTLVAFDGAGVRLGAVTAGSDAGASLELGALDRDEVWLSLIDRAGNESPRVGVRDGRLRLAAGGLHNPHTQRSYVVHDAVVERTDAWGQISGATGPGRTTPLVVPGGMRWLRRSAAVLPCPMASLGFDRRRNRLVAFGGTGCQSSGKVYELVGDTWLERVPSDPENDGSPASALGNFVWHQTLGQLLFVDLEGSEMRLWQWDGVSFRLLKSPGLADGGRTASSSRTQFATAEYIPSLDEVMVVGGFNGAAGVAPTCFWVPAGWRCTPCNTPYNTGGGRPAVMAPLPTAERGALIEWQPALNMTSCWNQAAQGQPAAAASPPTYGPLVFDEAREVISAYGDRTYERQADGGWVDVGPNLLSGPVVFEPWYDGVAGLTRALQWVDGGTSLFDVGPDGGWQLRGTVISNFPRQPSLATDPAGGSLVIVPSAAGTFVGRVGLHGVEPAWSATLPDSPAQAGLLPNITAQSFPGPAYIRDSMVSQAPNGAPRLMVLHNGGFSCAVSPLCVDVFDLDVNSGTASMAHPTFHVGFTNTIISGSGWRSDLQRSVLLMSGGSSLKQFEAAGGAAFDGGANTFPDGGLLPGALPHSLAVLTPPWALQSQVWGGAALGAPQFADTRVFELGVPWVPLPMPPMPAPLEPLTPLVLPGDGRVLLVQHGVSSETFMLADGGSVLVPLGDPEQDGLAPPSNNGSGVGPPVVFDGPRRRALSATGQGALWELDDLDVRPSQVLRIDLADAVLPTGASLLAVFARGAGGASATVDGISVLLWDGVRWQPLGAGAGTATALADFELSLADPAALTRLLAAPGDAMYLGVTSQGTNGLGYASVATQALELELRYRR